MAGNASAVNANHKITEVSLEATIYRADGRVEHLGRISYWHKNPLRRAAWRLYRFMLGK